MSEPLTVTFDNSCLDDEYLWRVEEACTFPIELAVSSVTLRENDWAAHRLEAHCGASPYVSYVDLRIPEVGVWDESTWDNCVWGGDEEEDKLEEILRIIGNGSFPREGNREELTSKQRNQLRDAMMFEAHGRHGRDIFVTNDRKGFVNQGRRELHQALFGTRIATPDEFLAELQQRSLS